MRLTYDRAVDAAFLYVADTIDDGEVDHAVEVPELSPGTMTLFHLDSQGIVLGIEFIGASRLLPPETLHHGRVERLD